MSRTDEKRPASKTDTGRAMSRRVESNHRPPPYQGGALPLSYGGKNTNIGQARSARIIRIPNENASRIGLYPAERGVYNSCVEETK